MLMDDDSKILEELRERPGTGAKLLVDAYGRRLYAAALGDASAGTTRPHWMHGWRGSYR